MKPLTEISHLPTLERSTAHALSNHIHSGDERIARRHMSRHLPRYERRLDGANPVRCFQRIQLPRLYIHID